MGLSTHVLDTGTGRPAAGVQLALSRLHEGTWMQAGLGITDADGRCRTLLGEAELEAGTYSIRFETAGYFTQRGETSLYPFVEIAFVVRHAGEHYHIPLLLTPNGYTTYRGS